MQPRGLGGESSSSAPRPRERNAAVPAGHLACVARHPLPRRARPCRASSAMDGKTDIGDPIAHTMPPDRIDDALELMHEGKSIRSVITF